ncbi:MAG TPA: ATPase, T2SS/T4P/T4SS family [Holophaga sp.]|nr:ATPase, T2SS/T4P/T4SS family [Holophaga sp.]
MAKIDKFIENMVSRGAPILRLDPGDLPMLEFPGGHRTALGGMELLGTVLDGLAKEILPPDTETSYLRGEKVNFDYVYASQRFQILVCRTNLGTRLVVGCTSANSGPSGEGTNWAARINTLIARLISKGGSDLYLNADEPPIFRQDGRLEVLEDVGVPSAGDLEEALAELAPQPILQAFSDGRNTEFSQGDPKELHRIRVSLFHDAAGPSIAIRVIPKSVPDASTLGLGETIQRLAQLNQGLVLFTGPMGCGKSTTMACLLEAAHRSRQAYIVGIHDSVEFEFSEGSGLLRQREVGRDPIRQHQTIRAAMRQAPDILAIGELRDAEGIELALQASRTGHVVFATLQSTSLVDTFYYMLDAFPVENQARIRGRLAECLRAVVGHTLLRRASGGGMAAALETLFNNPVICDLIRDGKFDQIPSAMKGGSYGQMSHNEALIQLVHDRKVEPMEAYLKCQDRESFIASCKKAGIDFDPRSAGHVTEVS